MAEGRGRICVQPQASGLLHARASIVSSQDPPPLPGWQHPSSPLSSCSPLPAMHPHVSFVGKAEGQARGCCRVLYVLQGWGGEQATDRARGPPGGREEPGAAAAVSGGGVAPFLAASFCSALVLLSDVWWWHGLHHPLCRDGSTAFLCLQDSEGTAWRAISLCWRRAPEVGHTSHSRGFMHTKAEAFHLYWKVHDAPVL